jgi:hypothetical protein
VVASALLFSGHRRLSSADCAEAPWLVLAVVPGTLYGDPVTDSIFVIDIAVPDNPAEFTPQLAPVLMDGKLVDVPAVTFLRNSDVSFPAIMK